MPVTKRLYTDTQHKTTRWSRAGQAMDIALRKQAYSNIYWKFYLKEWKFSD